MHSPEFINVSGRSDWFATPTARKFRPGLTLAEILEAVGVAPEFQAFYDVAINGDPVPSGIRHLVRPKVGTVLQPIVVTFHPPALHGGKKGTAKNVITVVATIALIAGTAFIGAGGLAALGASQALFGAGTAGAALAAAGFGLAGQLALQALAPPPVAANNQERGKQETIAGISGNPIQPFDYLPRVVGTMTLSPPFVAQPWSEFIDGNVQVNAIVGLAGNTEISAIKINGVSIDQFDNLEYETRDGSASVTDLTLITRCGFEQPGEAMTEFDLEDAGGDVDRIADQTDPDSCESQYHLFRSQGVADSIELRLAFPAGIYENGDRKAGMAFRIEIKEASSPTWIKGPEFHVSSDETWAKAFRQRVKLLFEPMVGSAVNVLASGGNVFRAYGYTGSASYHWQANAYFRDVGTNKGAQKVKIDKDGIKIYLDGAQWPKGRYDVRIRRSLAYRFSFFDQSAYTWDGSSIKAAFFDHYNNGGTYEVRVRQNNYVGSVQIEAFTTIKNTHPIGDKTGLALIAVTARKTRINSIAATFKSRARIYNGVTWLSTFSVTDNPAALYREVLIGDLNARPLAASMVDDQALGNAYLDCQENGYTCNGILQNNSVEQALQAIASAAYGVPRQEETWSILLERDTSEQAITQLFSPRNYANLSVERSFEPVPHAIRAIFFDETNDYLSEEAIVYRDGYNAGNATLIQAINYDMFTRRADVEARARFDLRQLQYRQTRYIFDLDWTHLVSSRGALVGLESDELGTASTSACIARIIRSGVNVTGLVLDAPVTSPIIDAGAIIQYADGSTVTRQIYSATDEQTINFLVPLADPGPDLLVVGNLVVVGLYEKPVKKRCKVFDIERISDLRARVTLLDEAPEIHA